MNNIESFEQFNEARVINSHPLNIRKEEPINDNEIIRVYHGFSSEKEAFAISKYGLTGKEKARRSYSYEAGNNPNGLFVTIDLDVAKRFATSGYIVEFHTSVSDLEAPVWAGGGSYFVAGDYTLSFNDADEREQQRLKNREETSKSKNINIANSDRPELASTLFDNAEKQGLFIGNLNPNMIRAYWVNDRLITKRLLGGSFVRLNRNDFVKMYTQKNFSRYDSDRSDTSLTLRKHRFFLPNDDYSEDILNNKLGDGASKYVNSLVSRAKQGDNSARYELSRFFYPKQISQLLGE